jgi:hypothetical protein
LFFRDASTRNASQNAERVALAGWLAGWLAASAVVLTPERAKREGTLKPMRLPFATTFLTSNNITSPHPTICLLAGNQT